MPTDELDSAEATLAVLQHALYGITNDDWSKQTPCREFDVAGLTDHLMNSITVIGGAAATLLQSQSPTWIQSVLVATACMLWGALLTSLGRRSYLPLPEANE